MATAERFNVEGNSIYRSFANSEPRNSKCLLKPVLSSLMMWIDEALTNIDVSNCLEQYIRLRKMNLMSIEGTHSQMHEAAVHLTSQLAQNAEQVFADLMKDVTEAHTFHWQVNLPWEVNLLTFYVTDHVVFLSRFRSTLKQALEENGVVDAEEHLASIVKGIVHALLSYLYGLSKEYEDPALHEIFLINSIFSILNAIRRPGVRDMFGNDWVQTHIRAILHHANQYMRISFAPILRCLSVEDLESGWIDSIGGSSWIGSAARVSRKSVENKLHTFNTLFEEIHQRQSQWIVFNGELRNFLTIKVAESVVPAYWFFITRYGTLIEDGSIYVRYTKEDVEVRVREFFRGRNMLNHGERFFAISELKQSHDSESKSRGFKWNKILYLGRYLWRHFNSFTACFGIKDK